MTARWRVEARPVAGPEQQGSSRSGDAAAPGGSWRLLPSHFRLQAVRASEKAGESRFETTFDQIFDSFPAWDLCEFESFILRKLATAPAASTASYFRISPVSASSVNAKRSPWRTSCALGSDLPGSANLSPPPGIQSPWLAWIVSEHRLRRTFMPRIAFILRGDTGGSRFSDEWVLSSSHGEPARGSREPDAQAVRRQSRKGRAIAGHLVDRRRRSLAEGSIGSNSRWGRLRSR
jgi:hypothetical protein